MRKPWGEKYGRKKVNVRGQWYDSKLEAAVRGLLDLREKDGEIRDIKTQQTVILQDGPREERITLRVDFSYTNRDDVTEYAEAKGFPTPEWKIKLKLWRKLKPGRLEIWGGSYAKPKLMEIIE